jgi:type IV pilus assembly protein PilW
MPIIHKHAKPHQAGFSLVEIMVGLVIGLLATLVILQVFSVYEGQKRTTTGTADAQTNGGIALYSLVRDLKNAGYGLLPTGNAAIKCAAPVISAAAQAGVTVSGTVYSNGVTSLDPVTITDGGGGLSDSITIRYGDSAAAGSSVSISSPAGSNPVTVLNNLSCQPNPGIALLITGPTTCNVTTVTALPSTTTVTLGDATGAGPMVALSCLGKWSEITYRSNAGNLERNAYPAGAGANPGTPAVADIVNIQAQYGVSATANSNQVVNWVDATGIWAAGTLTTANRNLVKAVRVAVIARNGSMEKTVINNSYSGMACDPTTLASNTPRGVCAWIPVSSTSPAPAVDLSNYPNWQQYRYRVFETIIPLRNVVWSRSMLP